MIRAKNEMVCAAPDSSGEISQWSAAGVLFSSAGQNEIRYWSPLFAG
jgi:hypothetical protein